MTRAVGIVTIAVMLAATTTAWAERAPWGDLQAWIGQYPAGPPKVRTGRLWDVPGVAAMLRRLLPAREARLLTRAYQVESRIERVGTFVTVSVCQPHACPDAHAMAVLDTEQGRAWFAFFERRPTAVSTRWYGTDAHSVLPSTVLDSFLSGHESTR